MSTGRCLSRIRTSCPRRHPPRELRSRPQRRRSRNELGERVVSRIDEEVDVTVAGFVGVIKRHRGRQWVPIKRCVAIRAKIAAAVDLPQGLVEGGVAG